MVPEDTGEEFLMFCVPMARNCGDVYKRQLKRYASWVQNVVRQFGPYLSWAQDI